MLHILYNPLSNGNRGKAAAEELAKYKSERCLIDDMTGIEYDKYFDSLNEGDEVILIGGDGTLNYFVNALGKAKLKNNVYFFKAGSGNDFFHDNEDKVKDNLLLLNDFLSDLPEVTVNGKTRYFINGIGFGLDGYCCEEGDKQRALSSKPVNYASIAIKGMISAFKPVNATVIVDGKSFTYKKVWLAPTMKGRYYGGGLMIAPNQDRFDKEKLVTAVVIDGGRLPVLILFPSIFKGKHIGNKHVHFATGKSVTVKFDRAVALQIDGETVKNVTEYSVKV